MNLLKDWTICVTVTLIAATIFSLITPNGKMGNLYKIAISLFVFLSFIIPLKDAKIIQNKFEFNDNSMQIESANDKAISNIIEVQVKKCLTNNGFENTAVVVDANENNGEIEINSVSVSVSDDESFESVKNVIFNELGINAEVHRVGD